MTPPNTDDDDRRDRFISRDGEFTVRRAPGKPPLPSQRRKSPSTAKVLGTLRRGRKLTQTELADRMGVDQGAISRLERREDHKISTVLDYLDALDVADVDLSVTFNNGEKVALPLARATTREAE